MLKVFEQDAFSVTTLTDAINKLPHKPGRIGSLGLFDEKGIRTLTVVIEEQDGRLSLIQSSPRGGTGSTLGGKKRKARAFEIPHFERDSKVTADDVQGVREFGSEDNTLAVQTVVNDRLAELRPMHDVTLEYQRIGAVQGLIKDADGTTLFDLFAEFGVAQQEHDIALSNAATKVRKECVAIQRLSESEMGDQIVTGYRAFCGDEFFDDLIEHANVTGTLQYQEGRTLREDLRKGFEYGGIVWENYRGKVGAVDFIPTDEAYVVPMGTQLFKTYFAPADFLETANTLGLPVYAKIAEGEMNRWAKVHTQSNPLSLCLRPRAVIKVTKS